MIMVKNKLRPVHPGEILSEEYLDPMGMSVSTTLLQTSSPFALSLSKGTALRLAR